MSTEDEVILEKGLIKQLNLKGYESVSINDESDLKNNFRKQIELFNWKKLNDVLLSDNEFRQIYNYLNQGTIFDRADKLRDQFVLTRDDESSVRIDFLNTKDYCKNIFQVSNQITMIRKYENRYDVTLLINGLPLVQIELKREGMEIGQAFDQIKRYMEDSYYDSLFNYIQLFVISNGVNTKYFANNEVDKVNFEFTFNWKDKDNNNILPLNKFADCFFKQIDEKIELMQKKHKNMEKIKESVIQKIFSKQLDKLNNESWNTIYLKDVVSIPKKEKLKDIEGKELLTVKLHCKGVEVNNNVKPKLTKSGRPYFERHHGELLIGRQNFHNGGIGFVTKELDSGICSNAITSLKIDESKINPNYLYYHLSRKSFYEKSEVVMGGTGQKELSEKELLKLKINLPNKENQKVISDILQSLDCKLNLCDNELNSLKEFKKGLLQKMFV